VHHDSIVGAYSLLGAGVLVAGSVHVGRNCYLGSGSRLRDNISIAPGTLVGLGSVVIRSIEEPDGVWAGTPARCLRAAVVE
jgi:UDP-3-O-[3-hydroxymyristoyl] glucosamine N-acyltransferase